MLILEKSIYAFVFARGGSKGLPGKNKLKIKNIPLLAHGINQAKQIKEIKGIFVSSECSDIGGIAVSYGAEWIKRPPELATDFSPEWLSWQHAINYVKNKKGSFKYFLSLPATAPLRSIEDIKKALNNLKEDVDIIVSMTKSKRSPWFNMVTKDKKGRIKIIMDETYFKRRQDAPLCYDLTTAFYFAKTEFILNANNIWEGKVLGVEIPEERGIDIDNSYDFNIAKFIAENPNIIN